MTAISGAADRIRAAANRAEAAQRRAETKAWVSERRKRTRQLIELGELIKKAGLVEFADDDRAVIYGALLDLVGHASNDRERALTLWSRRGKRAFDAEAGAADSTKT